MIPAATRYDVTTHAISSTLAEKLPCICGSETLTIEVSSTSSTVPSITASAINHLCAVAGRAVVAAAGIVALATRGYPAASRVRVAPPCAGKIVTVAVSPIDGPVLRRSQLCPSGHELKRRRSAPHLHPQRRRGTVQ